MDFLAPNSILKIPQYKAAVERETFLRESAFLQVPETVAGFELKQMTFSDYITLKCLKNPLVFDSRFPTPVELIAFLWFLSPDYSPDPKAKGRFIASKCSDLIPPEKPRFKFAWVHRLYMRKAERCLTRSVRVVAGIRNYLEETLADWPSSGGRGRDKHYYSDPIGVCALFAREYSWPETAVMALPMKRLFQYLREMLEASPGNDAPLGNPSDRALAEFVQDLNQKRANS